VIQLLQKSQLDAGFFVAEALWQLFRWFSLIIGKLSSFAYSSMHKH